MKVALALCALSVALVASLAPGAHSASPAASAAAAQRPILVGVWVRPRQPGPATVDAVEAAVGRRFDYALHYQRFTGTFPTADELDDKAKNRIPIVSLGCTPDLASVADGSDDATIDALASSMAAYGKTIELRYCWEMNGGYRHIDASDFIPAWRHLHDRFVQRGVRNVRWYFCPGTEQRNPASSLAYYPGDAYVDDVGVDTYDRQGEGFAAMIDKAYHAYEGIAKPFIIGETGALGTLDQASFLNASSVAMIRAKYPKIAAIVYFDAAGPHGDWSFTSQGLAAFAGFAKAARS
jgi:hypothetical protein